mgnify:CR=1 FL=1
MANTNVKRVKASDLELKDRLVSIQRVTKVTKGGRHFRFAAIVVVGNEKGVVGYGLGKANEVTAAIQKGVEDAKKNLVQIPIINTTIPHEQIAKFGGAEVFMKPAAPGTRCKGRRCDACSVRVCRCAERPCKIQGLIQPSQPGKGYCSSSY